MADIFLGLLSANESVNYQIVVIGFFLYILVLWIVVTIWVYKDAKARFTGKYMPIIMAIMNFLLFFPFLIIYLLIRPHFQDEFDDWHEGGVNIPIVNFTGKEGVVMSFELRVNPKKTAAVNDHEMKIDISFDSQDGDKQLVAANTTVAKPVVVESVPVSAYLSGMLAKFRTPKSDSEKSKQATAAEKNTDTAAGTADSQGNQDSQNQANQAAKHKKKKKKKH